MKKLWFRGLYKVVTQIAFNKIKAATAMPSVSGPVIYAAIHRNGALDGAVYQQLVPNAQLTIASQLRRNKFTRLVFDGIEILRSKDRARDGARVSNVHAFSRCAEHLAGNGQLLFFPEGTSELGARHLPFKAGVGILIEETLKKVPNLTVVPLAAHYEDATGWQSNVEVVAGAPILFDKWLGTDDAMQRITSGLEQVGLDCESLEERAKVETLAYAATLGNPDITYTRAIDSLRHQQPEGLEAVQARAKEEGLRLHQGIPLVPIGGWPLYLLAWLLLLPLVGYASLANLPVVLGAHMTSRKLSDGPNVVSMWRALSGTALLLCWTAILAPFIVYLFGASVFAIHLALSFVGLKCVYRFRKLSISLFNATRATPQLKELLLQLHADLTALVRTKGRS